MRRSTTPTLNQVKTLVASVTFVTLAILSCVPSRAQQPAAPEGFTALFDGKSLSNWHGRSRDLDPRKWAEQSEAKRAEWNADMKAHWTIEDSALVNDGHGVYLTTNEEFGDMELLIEYRTVAKADSGIYLRGTPQVQIWDWTDESKFRLGADKGSGGLWNSGAGAAGKDPSVRADKPFGEWNSFRIVQVGARTSVWLNGKQVVDHAIMENFWDRAQPLLAKGPIQLQTHGGEIRWRNLFIRKIGAEEANRYLREHSGSGFADLFNGKNLTGWKGSTENYEVVDGAIQCKADHGGVLYADKPYKNFVARLEFNVPAGGNNGLAIRYPGEGDTAYVGMCELQVLDNDAVKYETLDNRQYHGSAYGMCAAARGYLRPAGTWNYQEVTVTGSTIKVELNGTPILNCDLSKVTEFMGNKAHPGKDRTEGYFGFAGHNDPVRFRTVGIKELP